MSRRALASAQLDADYDVRDRRPFSRQATTSQVVGVLQQSEETEPPVVGTQKRRTTDRRFFLSLYSQQRLAWDLGMMISVLWVLMMTPFQLTYDLVLPEALVVLNCLVDVLFWVDICITFRTSYITSAGTEEQRSRAICYNYLSSYFFVDVLSALPGFPLDRLFGALVEKDVGSNTGSAVQSLKAVKSLKFMRALKFVKLLRLLRVFKLDNLMTKMELHFLLARKLLWGVKLFFLVCIFGHLNACFFSMVARASEKQLHTESWVESNGLLGADWRREYITSLYWSVTTLTTVGYGDISPTTDSERAYTIFAMISGGAFFGYVIGTISRVMATIDPQRAQFYQKMEAVRAYIVHKRFPAAISKRVYQYFKYYYETRSALNEDEILDVLSGPLRETVAKHMLKDTLDRIPIFAGLESPAISAMVPLLKPIVMDSGDQLLTVGASGRHMYILTEGTMLLRSTVTQSQLVEPVHCFGVWVALGKTSVHTANVQAQTDCKLMMLDGPRLLEIFEPFPAVLQQLHLVLNASFQKYQRKLEAHQRAQSRWSRLRHRSWLDRTASALVRPAAHHPGLYEASKTAHTKRQQENAGGETKQLQPQPQPRARTAVSSFRAAGYACQATRSWKGPSPEEKLLRELAARKRAEAEKQQAGDPDVAQLAELLRGLSGRMERGFASLGRDVAQLRQQLGVVQGAIAAGAPRGGVAMAAARRPGGV